MTMSTKTTYHRPYTKQPPMRSQPGLAPQEDTLMAMVLDEYSIVASEVIAVAAERLGEDEIHRLIETLGSGADTSDFFEVRDGQLHVRGNGERALGHLVEAIVREVVGEVRQALYGAMRASCRRHHLPIPKTISRMREPSHWFG